MNTSSLDALARAIVSRLQDGLSQDRSVLHAVQSTYGDASPRAIADVLSQRDSSDAATLAAMFLFPDADLRTRIEPLALAARCSPAEARSVEEAVERYMLRGAHPAVILLPDGHRFMLALEPGDAAAFVQRLQLADSPPEELSRLLQELFGPQEAAMLSVMLRTSRLDWNQARAGVVSRLLAGLGGNAAQDRGMGQLDRPVPELLAWTLSWLDSLGPDALAHAAPAGAGPETATSGRTPSEPADRLQDATRQTAGAGGARPGHSRTLPELLGAKHLELTTQLRRALDFNRALAKSSFEVMMSQGVRAPLMHPEAVREELALLDCACRVLTGYPAWTLSGLTEVDLGAVDVETDSDGEAMIQALGGGRIPPGAGPL
ncbi:MAG: hypothetical protein ACLGSA_02670 [Acidobacteriota bacterium]